jgi:prepilin-type N-terminal cleavage/methylation domain-containing protein
MGEHRQTGFTLVELLVVVLIVGLLSAIAAPVFNGQRGKSKDAAAKSNLVGTLHSTVGIYASEERWPNPSMILARLSGEEPSMTYQAYIPGTAETTGPRNISVSVEDAALITMCNRSLSGRVLCVRRDSLGLLPTTVASTGLLEHTPLAFLAPAAAQADDTNTSMMAQASASTEQEARALLPFRSSPEGQVWLDYPAYEPAVPPTPSSDTSTPTTTQAAAQEPANADPCLPDKNKGHGNDCFHYDPDNPGNGGNGNGKNK